MKSRAIDRRDFLALAVSASLATAMRSGIAAEGTSNEGNTICAFEKFLQDLSYDELADVLAELGFDGVEATVRNNGHVPPEHVEDELPKLQEALKQRGLEITIITTDIRDAEDPLTQRVLKTANALGLKRYRMGNYRYDLSEPIYDQVQEFRPKMAELAALNKEMSIQGMYQNHSGYGFFGATIWDLYEVIKDLEPSQLGIAFDIRHATVEAGLSWNVLYHLMRPHIAAVYVKDFRWEGYTAEHAPLGTSINPKFFDLLSEDAYSGPISLHVEYLPEAGVDENVEALRQDLGKLRKYLAS